MHSLDLLTIAAAVVPDRDATRFDGAALSYAQLADRANRLANALADRGVGAGDRVAVVDVNSPRHLEVYFAAARLDAVYAPINFRGKGRELAYPLSVAAPKALFAGVRYAPLIDDLDALPASALRVALDGAPAAGWLAYEQLLAQGGAEETRFPDGDPSETAALLFTAGTTGTPKAAPISHAAFTSFMLANVEPADPDAEERALLALPLYHVAGLQSALASVYGGRTLVVQRQFDAAEWLELAERERVQRALLVPTMIKQVLDHPDFAHCDLSALGVLTYGGAPMPAPLIERAIAALPHVRFINAFGQTETASTITMIPPEDHVLEGPPEVVAVRRRRLRSIGRPLPDVEVAVLDAQGAPLPPGATGEIAARGERVTRGYLGEEDGAPLLPGGWLPTGDLGRMDEDGYVYLEGRAKDFIKRGGEMVSPEEVENVLLAHPGVDECAVVGLPDDTWGERVAAVIVPKPGHHPAEAELRALAEQRLARFKRPEQLVFADHLPRNDLGKVLKRELRERLGSG